MDSLPRPWEVSRAYGRRVQRVGLDDVTQLGGVGILALTMQVVENWERLIKWYDYRYSPIIPWFGIILIIH